MHPERPQNIFLRRSALIFYIGAGLFALSILYAAFLKAPDAFLPHTLLVIREGETGTEAADELKGLGLIQSRTAFKAFLRLFGGTTGLVAGDYSFERPANVIALARRLASGAYGIESVRVTLYEGSHIHEMADILREHLYRFDPNAFVDIASTSEGYLFPDTYFFMPNANEQDVYDLLRRKFDERIAEVDTLIRRFDRPLEDVVKMASILEKEARTELSRRMIAGILWKRIDEGMPLQVDAVFAYVIPKSTFELTTEDLQDDHPFNTYTRKGLPPTPIGNPGLDSIRAAVTPIESPYYYYLSDMDGEMHYAATHDDHVANKDKYLRPFK